MGGMVIEITLGFIARNRPCWHAWITRLEVGSFLTPMCKRLNEFRCANGLLKFEVYRMRCCIKVAVVLSIVQYSVSLGDNWHFVGFARFDGTGCNVVNETVPIRRYTRLDECFEHSHRKLNYTGS